ncbi:MAG: DegV family protein [Clostridiales bacterium]|nr:DegV family protein [Clostridiales bacterium]
MHDYILSCCSTCDLTAQHLKDLNIEYVPFHFILDGQEYDDDLGQSISYDEFYRRMEEGADTRTSQVNVSEYVEFFTPFLEAGKDILHVSVSSGLSGSCNSALNAARILKERYPDRKLTVVDSLAAASGYGLLMDKAAQLRDEGMSLDELASWLNENKLKLHHWFFSTDLKYYVKGGRISKASGFVGTVLGICPLLNVDLNGRLMPREKVRSKKKVIRQIVKMMEQHAQGGADYDGKVYLCQSACMEDAQAVADLVKEKFPRMNGEPLINHIGATIGSHSGPGTVALFFWGDPRKN